MSDVLYPRRKVFFALFLSPLIVGLFAGGIEVLLSISDFVGNPRLLGVVSRTEIILMPLVTPALIQLVYTPPFLVYAVAVVLFKVKKSPRNCFFVALVGSVLATIWSFLLVVGVVETVVGAKYSNYSIGLLVLFFFVLAICWFAAVYSLPEKGRKGANLFSPREMIK